MIKKLRIKFVCINMAIVTAMLAIIFSLLIFFMGIGTEIQGQQAIQEIVDSALPPERWMEQLQTVRRPHFLVRINQEGEVLTIEGGSFEKLGRETLLEYTRAALEQNQESGTLKEHELRFQVMAAPIGKMLVFADISGEMASMRNLLKICYGIAAVSFIVFLGISILLAGWAIRPVEQAWDRQRQFVADASHELKTPLTVILTNAELLNSGDYSQQEKSQFVSSILTMSHQMRGLVESLLELARVDNGSVRKSFGKVNFGEVVSDALLPFEPVYFERELTLESQIGEGLCVRGSQSHLRQVVEILLDNAAKYSQSGATVTVKLSQHGGNCLLQVANPGEPIEGEQRKRIFERFYRADKARAMNHSYGLGLPIAMSILQEHGGKIWVDSAEGINTFNVQLPVI